MIGQGSKLKMNFLTNFQNLASASKICSLIKLLLTKI